MVWVSDLQSTHHRFNYQSLYFCTLGNSFTYMHLHHQTVYLLFGNGQRAERRGCGWKGNCRPRKKPGFFSALSPTILALPPKPWPLRMS